MIQDIETLEPGATLRADACVIGTGHAGMEAIRTLRRSGLSVVVAEGGRRDFSKEAQEALTRLDVVGRPVREPDPEDTLTPYLAPELRGEGRLRQLGGNSNIWTGKWREFEPLDFRVRPHVPHSGWPIEHAEMLRWYREIERDYGFAEFERFEAAPELAPLREAAGDGLAMSFHYWEAEPLRVAQRHGAEVEADPGARVILGANAVALERGEGGRIERLRARSTEGREVALEADHFVLAVGGIEVPRLLLASDRRDPGGIGNAHGLVGRFFQDHPKLKRGRLVPGPTLSPDAGRRGQPAQAAREALPVAARGGAGARGAAQPHPPVCAHAARAPLGARGAARGRVGAGRAARARRGARHGRRARRRDGEGGVHRGAGAQPREPRHAERPARRAGDAHPAPRLAPHRA